ncbi:Hypothetical predicted protein, partial [Olea europaea subsp. europaea]
EPKTRSNMSEEVKRQLERFCKDMRDRLDWFNTKLANFHRRQCPEVPNVRRQGSWELRMEIRDIYGDSSEVMKIHYLKLIYGEWEIGEVGLKEEV